MNHPLPAISFASLFVGLGLVLVPPVIAPPAAAPPAAAPAGTTTAPVATAQVLKPDPAFLGQDRFDDIRTLDQLRELEREVTQVAERVRQSVVLLRGEGRGGAASGTAVIISKDGLLATCGHVGRRAGRDVTAVLADGTQIRGRTLGQSVEDGVDCGLVQLDTEGRELPAAPVGTTVGLARGDWVIALGYTHGLSEVNRPSLLRVGRVLRLDEKELFIDAPIDAGDSGGPSFNLRGEVVGLNSRCGRESWQNVATPIDLLNERMETLRTQLEPPQPPPDADVLPRPRGSRQHFPAAGGDVGKRAVERTVPLNEVAARVEPAIIRVYCDGRPVAYGLLVDGSGLAVTKASQLEEGVTITVETAARERLVAQEAARDPAMDLALLRFTLGAPKEDARERIAPVQWAVDASVAPGAVLVTPRGFGEGAALGFAAIEHRESETDRSDGPFLGVQTRPANSEELERASADHAVTVVRVVPGAAAERAGLVLGHILLAVDDKEIDSPGELRRVLGQYQAGDQVRLKTVGPDGADTLEVALGRRGDSNQEMRRGNTATPISRRSTGLGSLLAHDAITEPAEMGGPVVDFDGRVVGMNIARYDRTATHAIGADRMAEACQRLIEQARHAAEADPPAPPK